MSSSSPNGTEAPKTGLVAVVGLGCVFPDANSVDEFWNNIKNGRSSVREIPKSRWDPALYYSPDRSRPDATYSKIGSFVTTFQFDSKNFRIPPNVLKSLDDSQLWALAAAQQALADAGYDQKPFDRSRCAVILGNAMGGEIRMATGMRIAWPLVRKTLVGTPAFADLPAAEQERALVDAEARYKSQFPHITEDTMPGELSNVIAGRIANLLNLTGKNFTTDAACASSLAAIDAAAKALLSYECDFVLTGGVDRSQDIGTYVKFCKIGALSAAGSFPFDARADGFVMGEGCGMLLLKRLDDAQRDGDRIYAVVRGVGSSSDGKGKGITAPNIDGQLSCLTRALADAQVPPGEIDFVECHGTSTKVGDVVEVQALTKIFAPHVSKRQSIPIGSVKSNVGHLKSAAGAASLLKMIRALHEKVLPPSINYQTPNPNLKLEETPFYVNAAVRPWPEPPAGRPRRAGISSFGFGGTNFHVVLEEYAPGKNLPKTAIAPRAVASVAPAPVPTGPVSSVLLKPARFHRTLEPLAKAAHTDVLVVGAATMGGLDAEIRSVQQQLTASVKPDAFHSFLHAQNSRAIRAEAHVACVVESPTDAVEKLSQALDAVRDPSKRPLLAVRGIYAGQGRRFGKLAFVFPGQGSQYADMLRDLSTRFETVKRTLEEADRVMVPLIGKPLTEFMFVDPARGVTRDQAEEALKRTEITQPAVLAADLALYRLLADYDVKPDFVAGHSLGEYGALVAAGVLSLEDAMFAVSARGREMANVHVPDLGKMASVSADPAAVEARLKQVPGYVIPANKNCKVQTVIAGESLAVEAAVKMFNEQGIPAQTLPVSAAFHSAIVAPAQEPMRRVFERLDFREPKIPVLSNVHADYYPRGPGAREKILDLLSSQVAAPVEWQRQVERMHTDGARTFVEVGPKATLTTFVKNILEGQPHHATATNHPKKGGFFHFFDSIAMLAAAGYPLKFPGPDDPAFQLPAFRESVKPYAEPARPPAAPSAPVTTTAFPQLAPVFESFVREKQEELRQVLTSQLGAFPQPNPDSTSSDPQLLRLQKRVDDLGLNLDQILITGVSVGTPGTTKKLFDDTNFDRIFAGENAIERLTHEELEKQVEKNIVRLVKSETGDHRFELIQDTAEVIQLAAKKGEFDFEKEYGVSEDFAAALDVTSKMAIAAGIEALRDAQIPLVRGYVKTTTGKFLPGEWALPEPLRTDTGVIFGSVWPGVTKIVEYVSQFLGHKYGKKRIADLHQLYAELTAKIRDPQARADLQAWYAAHEPELNAGDPDSVFKFNRRFLFHVLSMGHSQLAQFIRAKGPNTQINAACATTTQGVALAEDWIRTGRCKRVLLVGADDITNPQLLDFWTSGFLAAGAATTKADVREAALPFDKRRHGMIIGMGAVGMVIEAEQEVRKRGMEGITEILATVNSNSAFHGSRLDIDHIATLMNDLLATVEKRTGTPRSEIAKGLLFMSHETYTPARGGSAAAEIEALTRTFGPDVGRVVVANTKGFTGHPMGASIEDAIAIRSLQTGRVPPIANLREPDPSLGNIHLSRGGSYDLQYGLRLAAGFGSQIAMFVMKLRSKDVKRIVDVAKYQAWLAAASGTRNPELEIVNRTLRVKAQLPALTIGDLAPARPTFAPPAVPRPATPPPALPIPVPAAALAIDAGEIQRSVVSLIAEKTGYPLDMLDPNLDLEADLGIDTVKQAELFGLLRESYRIERDDSIQLKNYPTIAKIAEFLQSRLHGTTAPIAIPSLAASLPAPIAPTKSPSPPAPRSVATGDIEAHVADRLMALVCEKTGYAREMLDPDLDLEADLGIDTVKQAEVFGLLRSQFELERDDNVQLKDYNTLRRITGYISERAKATPSAVPSAAPTVVPAAPRPTPKVDLEPVPAVVVASPPPASNATRTPVVASAPIADRAEILERIRTLVAQKTGYTPEVLEDNLDLEADLGIDTVKQAEIFGLMRDSFGIPRLENFQLKDYNTLGRFADFVLEYAGKPAPVSALVERVLPTTVATERTERTTRRYVVRYVSAPAPPPVGSLQGKTLLVWAPPNVRHDVLHALKESAAVGVGLEALPHTYDEAKNLVEEQRRRTPRLNGLIFVPTPNAGGSEFEAEDTSTVKSLFYLVKALLATGRTGELEVLGTATFLGGDFGAHLDQAINPLEGAVVGVAKAVAKELPGANVKCVDFASNVPAPRLASVLTEELRLADGHIEIGTRSGRGTLKLLERETVEEEPGIELGPSDVIVVSGGGTGITTEIVATWAERIPAAFLLLGRTALVPNVAELERKTPQEWQAIRQQILVDLKEKGERATPVAADREVQKLLKSVEIYRTLRAVRAAGARAEYRACDVTDAHAVERALAEARRTWGPITGIVHAAGVEESKLIVDKTPASFDRVFDVKVLGARNLLRAAANDPLRFFFAFSSVAGRFGNVGQADYSAANDALAKLSHALRLERGPQFPAVTIDWSAWAGKGMATRGSVMTVLREAGVAAIPLGEGVRRFLDELAHGGQDPEVLIAGDLGRMAPSDAFTQREEPPAPRPAPKGPAERVAPVLERDGGQTVLVLEQRPAPTGNLLTQVSSQDARTVTATLFLDPAKDPYLRDHAVDGVPYLPGVFGLEAFAETAARLATGHRYVGATNVEYKLPVKLLRNRPMEVTLVASVATESSDRMEIGCRLQSVFVNGNGERVGAPRIHFTGTLLFARETPTSPMPAPAPRVARAVEPADIYRSYFHGPSFQVLDRLELAADGETVVGTWANPESPLLGDREPSFLAQPTLVELAFQTAGGHELYHASQLALPNRIKRIQQFATAPLSTPIVAVARLTGSTDRIGTYDVVVQTRGGGVLLVLEGFELIRIRPLEAPTPPPSTPARGPVNGNARDDSAVSVYKSRWGHDFPVPLSGAMGCRVQADEVASLKLRPEECLTAGERTDQERFRHAGRSDDFFLGRLAAKEAISQLLDRPVREARGIEIRRLESGEPAARGQGLEDVLVSITHTGTQAIAVAARRGSAIRTLGFDADRIEEKPRAFETESFAPAELDLLDELFLQGRRREELQLIFWTAKEAVLKALGKGFALDLHDVRVRAVSDAGRIRVELAPPALESLRLLGAGRVDVQSWIQDGHAYAAAWTQP